MLGPSRQVGFDTASPITIFWTLFYVGIFYWFYSTIKRIERTLEDIKKQLEKVAQGGTRQDVEKPRWIVARCGPESHPVML